MCPKLLVRTLATVLTLAVLAPSSARAATNTWNNAAGDFVWDFSSTNWLSPEIWSDGDDAVFGATGVGEITLNSAVTVQSQTFNTAGYNILGNGNNMTMLGTNSSIIVNGDATNTASLFGTNGLIVRGTGTLTLQGDPFNLTANHYTGGTYIRSGTVVLSAPYTSQSGTSYAVDSIEALDTGATLKWGTIFNGSLYVSPALHQIASHSTAFVSKLHMTGGTFDLNNEPRNEHMPCPEGTGLIINNGAVVQSGIIIYADGQNHTFNGLIADGGPLVGDNSGQGPGRQIGILSFAAGIAGGELTLTASNTYSGSTRLQFGSIKLAGNGTIGFPTTNGLTGPLRIYGPSHLDLNGRNQTIALMTSGDANGKIYNTATGTVSTLTFGFGNETSTSRNAGMQYIDNPGTGGILAMRKIGNACIQTLSGVNTYSGDTTVSEGTLALATIAAVSPNSAFRLTSTANLKLTYAGTANVRQLWVDGVQKPNGVYGSGTSGIDPASTGTLTVVGSAPVSLVVTQAGGSIKLSWSGVYKLQAKTNNIVGPWFDYASGGTSPVTVPVDQSAGSVYFRLATYSPPIQ